MSNLRRHFTQDMFGDPIQPDMMYEVQVWPRNADAPRGTTELVSGEELIAAAEWIDHFMSQGDDNGT